MEKSLPAKALLKFASLAASLVTAMMQPPDAHSGHSLASAASSQRPPRHSVVFTSRRYGFSLTLPETWKGYRVLNSTWEAEYAETEKKEHSRAKESGPTITIRHPLWTKAKPRQDIPIMVLTIAQWNKAEQLVFGAAPIGPSEMAHNGRFVFALPARYNYAFPLGFEEVQNIAVKSSFRTFQPQPN